MVVKGLPKKDCLTNTVDTEIYSWCVADRIEEGYDVDRIYSTYHHMVMLPMIQYLIATTVAGRSNDEV